MPSNSLLHFIAKVVNFEGFKTTNYHFISENELLLVLDHQSQIATCPHCQKNTDKIHQSHWYRVRDLPWSNFEIFLQVNRRQFRCRNCRKVFSEELSFVKKRRTYTKRLAAKVVKEVLETDIVNTAKRNGLTPAEIETLLKEAEEDFLTEKPKDLKKLGIDEITHLKGGKNYAAVLVDLEKRKPIAFLEKRNKEVIAEYLIEMGSEILNQIEEVSIDLWKPYKSVVEELLPNAKVVADRFHVMKQVNEELDQRRRADKKQAEKLKKKKERERKIEGLKHSKYPLLKKQEDLDEEEKEKLKEVAKVAPELMHMYEIKEELRKIFESEITADEALWKIIEWLESAYKYLPKSCQTVRRWLEEILGYFDHRTTQGVVEGINQKIKLIKRRAFGFMNFNNFRRRMLLNWHFCC